MEYEISKVKDHLSDSSRKLADLTASMVYDNPSLIMPLLEISWSDEYPWCQRASRVLWICSLQNPDLLKPHVSKIIRRLQKQESESVRRNFLKLFYDTDFKISERDTSRLLDLCFEYLNGPFSIAVRVYAMDILFKLSKGIPEIQRELYETIETQMDEGSAGYKSHGIKIMKKIARDFR